MSAATIRSPVLSGHWLGSSQRINDGAKPMRPAGIGTKTAHHRAGFSVLDSGQLAGLPNPVPVPVFRAISHEGY